MCAGVLQSIGHEKKTGPPRSTHLALTSFFLSLFLPSSHQHAGPEVDADRVKAAMQALRADMEASREAARQR
jgi:hypothetical protein